jgi:hypothetical protein
VKAQQKNEAKKTTNSDAPHDAEEDRKTRNQAGVRKETP